jgi:hypothetical protein
VLHDQLMDQPVSCYCEGCGLLLEIGYAGSFRCPGCARVITLSGTGARISAAGAGILAPGALRENAAGRCTAHPGSPVAAHCERCGDFLCRSCTRVIQGRLYCLPCFSKLRASGLIRDPDASRRGWLLVLVLCALGVLGFTAMMALARLFPHER